MWRLSLLIGLLMTVALSQTPLFNTFADNESQTLVTIGQSGRPTSFWTKDLYLQEYEMSAYEVSLGEYVGILNQIDQGDSSASLTRTLTTDEVWIIGLDPSIAQTNNDQSTLSFLQELEEEGFNFDYSSTSIIPLITVWSLSSVDTGPATGIMYAPDDGTTKFFAVMSSRRPVSYVSYYGARLYASLSG